MIELCPRITIRISHLEQIFAHAREVSPAECCGLVGGRGTDHGQSIYRLTNVAIRPEVSYEAAPEELFSAQRQMRERGEQLLAIYHSHPLAAEPRPSETDVRLAYYPSATYLIVGLAGAEPTMRAFQISERDGCWQQVEYAIADE
jgi:proteasome lid subunit RPN8/RPN11